MRRDRVQVSALLLPGSPHSGCGRVSGVSLQPTHHLAPSCIHASALADTGPPPALLGPAFSTRACLSSFSPCRGVKSDCDQGTFISVSLTPILSCLTLMLKSSQSWKCWLGKQLSKLCWKSWRKKSWPSCGHISVPTQSCVTQSLLKYSAWKSRTGDTERRR